MGGYPQKYGNEHGGGQEGGRDGSIRTENGGFCLSRHVAERLQTVSRLASPSRGLFQLVEIFGGDPVPGASCPTHEIPPLVVLPGGIDIDVGQRTVRLARAAVRGTGVLDRLFEVGLGELDLLRSEAGLASVAVDVGEA